MKLSSVATFFDRETVLDGYDGETVLFQAQFSSFDGRQPDGSLNKRRQMSIASDITLPVRRVILYEGARWIIGDGNSDTFFDEKMRQSFSLKKATALYQLYSPASAALLGAAVAVYGQALYFRDFYDQPTTADSVPIYNLFFGQNENIGPYPFMYDPDKNIWFHRKEKFYPIEGYVCAASDESSMGRVVATFTGEGTVYNPTTDSYAGTTISTFGLMFEYTQLYARIDEGNPKGAPGDKALIVSKAAVTPKNGDTLAVMGTTYRIKAVVTYLDAWLLHLQLS